MSVGGLLATSAAAIAVVMVATWLLSLPLRDVSIVDIVWGLGFTVVAWATWVRGDGGARGVLVLVMVTVWGLRLAGYLAWRNIGSGEDPRYQAMRRRIGRSFPVVSLVTVFLLQGVVMWTVSLPLPVAMADDGRIGVLQGLGLAVWATGWIFETVGDLQLAAFKSDPDNRGRVMDRGLWRYTRHPNYFGDFCVWWGIWLVTLGAPWAWVAVVGPATMTVFLLRVSGVAMLERSIGRRRPGYADYVRRTSAFFPLPPRPGAAGDSSG
jgi:steroid 5-alpha reductase family enzyme